MQTNNETAQRQAGFGPAAGSAAAETVERRMWVGLTAHGFNGRFELPEKHFNDLLTWLAERSCGQEKQPNHQAHRSALAETVDRKGNDENSR